MRAARGGSGRERRAGHAAAALFAPAIAAAAQRSAALSRLAAARRTRRGSCFRRSSRALDRAVGAAFPFTKPTVEGRTRVDGRLARVGAAHDAEFKLRAADGRTRARRVGRLAVARAARRRRTRKAGSLPAALCRLRSNGKSASVADRLLSGTARGRNRVLEPRGGHERRRTGSAACCRLARSHRAIYIRAQKTAGRRPHPNPGAR